MNKNDAEKIAAEYLKPIYGFALKRCRSMEDAEDLSQEIILKIFKTLLSKDDIADTEKFIWTVAHNSLCNYYRDSTKLSVCVPLDEISQGIAASDTLTKEYDSRETISRLQLEIAYLSKLQRRIVIAYYFENKKQAAIAEELGIPVGTVKWHLFEAKKDLKKGMDNMRQAGELKFNPIAFDMCNFSGRAGTKGDVADFFRSSLSQNIVYTVRDNEKTVGEIADALGVSPVYVESEAEYLEEYGFLIKKKNGYICNILLNKQTDELYRLHDEMYMKAAKIFANELYDELTVSGILEDQRIYGGITAPFTMSSTPSKDKNFMLWSLIPYIAAVSGENTAEKSIAFEDVCTIRPDGGKNICQAEIKASSVTPPMYSESMKKWRGPFWNGLTDKIVLWIADSEWSERRITENYQTAVVRDLSLLERLIDGQELSQDEYTYLAQQGYISVFAQNGCVKTCLKCLYLSDKEIQNELIAFGDRIKERHKEEFDALKAPYIKAVLNSTPKHLRRMQECVLQYIFCSDAWFLLHCMKELVNNGKLIPPAENQKNSVTALIAPN